VPGDDEAALAARVLKEEHRIYPQALDELASSMRASSGGSGTARVSPAARNG
jgi:phosphoribosylglycinamide formyltransferase-1